MEFRVAGLEEMAKTKKSATVKPRQRLRSPRSEFLRT
jgi:hypothetical protein